MLFDEIKVETTTYNDSLYVNVPQLTQHLTKAIYEFIRESNSLSHVVALSPLERAYIMGLIDGMQNVAITLRQGLDEHDIGTIDTIEELLERFKDVST